MFFLFSSVTYSQNENGKKPLLTILAGLEQKFDLQFTYADDLVENVLIVPPPQNIELKELFKYLEKKTGLIFEALGNNIVTISSPNIKLEICGYLIDNETRLPLEAATIIGFESSATSDSFGYFKIVVSGPNEKLLIRHLGFQSESRSANYFLTNTCTNIFMTPNIEVLSEIVLSNYITKGINKMADGSYYINYADFGVLPGLIETDVLQTLQALPGILSHNETVSDISIRGGTNDQNLIMWDGIKMYQAGHFFGLISIFNPLITTDVKLIKNGSNVELSDGVSGTIAMTTDTSINNSFNGSAGLNFLNADVYLDLPTSKNSSLQVAGRKAINDLFNTPTYTSYFERISQDTELENPLNENKDFDFYDASLRWLYKISEKDLIRINFLAVNNELVFNETGANNQSLSLRQSSLKQSSISEGIFYRRQWNAFFLTSLQIYETDYKLNALNIDLDQGLGLEQENKVSETSIKLNTWFELSEKLTFLNGYQFKESGISNLTEISQLEATLFDREVIREHAIFSQANYTSNSARTKVSAGIRYNYIDKFSKHLFEPRFSANYRVFDFLTLEVLGELKHQTTSQIINFQNDFLGIEKRRWRLSNPLEGVNIPIIKSKQASLGANFNNNGWVLATEIYYKEVDGISSQSQGFVNQYEFEKINGSYDIKGLDLLVNKRFKSLSSWISYAFSQNDYTFKDLEEVNFPNNLDIRHAFSFGISYSKANLKIAAGINWHSGKPTTLPVPGNELDSNGSVNYKEANSDRLDEYLRLDASLVYKKSISKNVKAVFGISVWNLLDQENIVQNYFSNNDGQVQEITKAALGFTPNMSLRFEFN